MAGFDTPDVAPSGRLDHRSNARATPRVILDTMTSDYRDRITIDPGRRGGKPCIRDLRITVYDVLEYLAAGMSEQEILADFPDLELEDVRACLSFAADRERKLVKIS
jgi:uncharacterized protein (DUF433 family)